MAGKNQIIYWAPFQFRDEQSGSGDNRSQFKNDIAQRARGHENRKREELNKYWLAFRSSLFPPPGFHGEEMDLSGNV